MGFEKHRIFSTISKLWHQVFSRILFIYSVTIFIVISLLLLFIGHFLHKEYVDQALEANDHTLDRLETYFDSRNQNLSANLLRLYYNNDLVESVAYALQNNREDYWKYRLDSYTKSNSFVPTTIDSFVNTMYLTDQDIDAINISSLETGNSFNYIFNHYNWSQMRMEKEGSFLPDIKNGIAISKPIHDGVSPESIGTFTAYYSLDKLNKDEGILGNSEVGGVQVYSLDKELLFSSVDELENVPVPTGMSNNEQIEWAHEDGTYYLNHRVDYNLGFIYVGVIPEHEIEGISFTFWFTILAIIFLAVTVVLTGYAVIRKYARRMREIEYHMLEVQDGNFTTRVNVSERDKDELSTIANSFNRMVKELNSYIDRAFVLEMKKREAEMRALQSQINPHFLYNTLESIRMKAVIEGSKGTAAMTYHLATTLRYALSDKQQVQLKEELEHLKQYMKIMEYRFESKLSVDYKIDESLLSLPVLRFILQPVAENYIIHGFKADQQGNLLQIQVKTMEDCRVAIVMSDNGKGMELERLHDIQEKLYGEEVTSTDSIGLSNIHQRIQLQYGKPHGLFIKSEKDKGTEVTLILPVGHEITKLIS